MDLLQVALVLLILVLGVMLSILGFQVFLILKDLRKSLDKIDLLLGSVQRGVSDVEKPIKTVSELGQMMESGVKTGVKTVKKLAPSKPTPRLFKRR